MTQLPGWPTGRCLSFFLISIEPEHTWHEALGRYLGRPGGCCLRRGPQGRFAACACCCRRALGRERVGGRRRRHGAALRNEAKQGAGIKPGTDEGAAMGYGRGRCPRRVLLFPPPTARQSHRR